MTTIQRSKWLFWIMLLGLVAFVVAFGTPFLSAYTSGKVVSLFGCSPAGLDRPAVCPDGSIAAHFAPLTHWIGSVLAPVIFVKQFWGLIVCWGALILFAAYFAAGKPGKADTARIEL